MGQLGKTQEIDGKMMRKLGKTQENDGKKTEKTMGTVPWVESPCLMGKSMISMVIFNGYVKLPEGKIDICIIGI